MHNFYILTKLRLNEHFHISEIRHTKDVKKQRIACMQGLTSLALLAFLFFIIYSLANFYGSAGYASTLPIISYVFGSMCCFIFTVLRINDLISGSKDAEFLFALPPANGIMVILLFLKLYIESTGIALLLELPMRLVYLKYVSIPSASWGAWFIGLLITSLPLGGIGALAGMILALLLSGQRHRNFIQSLCSIVAISAVIIFLLNILYNIGLAMANPSHLATSEVCENIIQMVGSNSRFGRFYQRGIVEHHIEWIFGLTAISIIWYIGFLMILGVGYQEFILGLDAPVSYKIYDWKKQKTRSLFAAVFKRQKDALLHSKSYLMSSSIGLILALCISGWFAFHGATNLLHLFRLEQMLPTFSLLVPIFLCICMGLSNTTFCSLSMEGHTHWIWASSAVEDSLLYKSSVLLNLCMSIPCAIISGSLFLIAFGFNVSHLLMFILLPALYAILGAIWGILMDAKFADYKENSEDMILRSSTSYYLGKLPQIILPILIGCIYIFA